MREDTKQDKIKMKMYCSRREKGQIYVLSKHDILWAGWESEENPGCSCQYNWELVGDEIIYA